jgi:hypothetical protein
MSEWWTYTLSDFLLFSPRTYYRLFELHHRAFWPLQIVTLAAGALMLFLAARGGRGPSRGAVSIAAAVWLWVAWSWHVQRYATINWAADWIGAAFALEGLLLLSAGVATTRFRFPSPDRVGRRLGLGMTMLALAVQPLAGVLAGRTWSQIEVFGITPDPTAIATLGLLLAGDRHRTGLAVIPILWCLLDGATLWALEAPDAWVMPAAATFAVAALMRPGRSSQAPGPGAVPTKS